ncbi:response regulator transcription factor [Pseudomonas huaxiensis]|uniref:response regulator transcription factor n=1 Tax=Pseudomonas huaxiensis TaxID=2213017 RepID=UPI000DA6A78B|nr:response regulator [Pseudomonas huaxiensis]
MKSVQLEKLVGRRILVVDDVDAERQLLAEYLQHLGCRVYLATNGQDAFRKVHLVNPDLILMDVFMPVCDGLKCCRMLQANKDLRHIPVIFLTGAGMPEQRVQGLLAGAVDYISKPYNLDEVRLRLSIHLKTFSPTLTPALADPNKALGNLDKILFESTKNLMLKSLSQTPELAELAAAVGTNTKRLNEAFRNCVGITVFEYLREERMKEACMLLTKTAISIQDIAIEIGFTGGANFSTAFKDRYGVSPRDFRSHRQALDD